VGEAAVAGFNCQPVVIAGPGQAADAQDIAVMQRKTFRIRNRRQTRLDQIAADDVMCGT